MAAGTSSSWQPRDGGVRPADGGSRRAHVYMHPTFLEITPPEFEAAYWNRYSRFDLANCAIPVLYFGKTLSTWFSPALLTIYFTVMIIKLYQAYLLLWSPAQHTRWRKTILWWERSLRTLISVRLVAYSPVYKQWLGRAPFMLTARVLLLNSGFTIAYWNIFCLPLDFSSQVILTTAFVLSSMCGAFADVRNTLDGLFSYMPVLGHLHELLLGWLSRSLGLLVTGLYRGTWAGLPLTAAASGAFGSGCASGGRAGWMPGLMGGGAEDQQQCGVPGAVGRGEERIPFVPVVACCYTLYVCGVCPLWLAYHMERVHKQRWLQSHPSVTWMNPPGYVKAGKWPTPREALSQLGKLLVISFVVSEAVVVLWGWLEIPM